jgi:hypothetical protein
MIIVYIVWKYFSWIYTLICEYNKYNVSLVIYEVIRASER